MRNSNSIGELPKVDALVLFDQVSADPATRKVSCLGAFYNIFAKKFPATQPSLGVFASMTNLHGTINFKVAVCSATDESELAAAEGTITCNDPLASVDLPISFPPIAIPAAGAYFVRLSANGQMLQDRRFIATLSPAKA